MNAPNARPRVLVTAGPTYEPIDAVRFIGNRSSGRMGVALADQFAARACPTTLMLGPNTVCPSASHTHLTTKRFQTCNDLRQLMLEKWPQHELLVMAAAVADFTPRTTLPNQKRRRTSGTILLELDPTPDLIAEATRSKRDDQRTVAFALETRAHLAEAASRKLHSKSTDAIIANPLGTMDADTIEGFVIFAGGKQRTPPNAGPMPKIAFANWLVDVLLDEFFPST